MERQVSVGNLDECMSGKRGRIEAAPKKGLSQQLKCIDEWQREEGMSRKPRKDSMGGKRGKIGEQLRWQQKKG